MISLTDAAQAQIQQMASKQEIDATGVRVMVMGGGCSGLQYDMDFAEAARDGDEVIETNSGLKVFIDPTSASYLDGTRIDYVESFSFSGFRFENPNARKSCSCGSSFAA